ncbi:MAG: phosphate signaling complex protein PhoU [Acidimicrobiia bacterium]|nr:phosphate signaling complex protein PhoU [Acidimicrobiia bacterium]
MMVRKQFHQQLDDLQDLVVMMGDLAGQRVGKAVDALATGNQVLADEVIAGDSQIDEIYMDAHRRWLRVTAEQQPMAGDLRLLTVILHMTVTLERMGDQAVNIAKIGKLVAGLPVNQTILSHIQEMADTVRPMVRTALDSFVKRDVELAMLLPVMDDPVDRLDANMHREVMDCHPDPELLEWATHMLMVSRALERVGDQAVDIAEQVAFLLTGEFQEFSSFPERGSNGDD